MSWTCGFMGSRPKASSFWLPASKQIKLIHYDTASSSPCPSIHQAPYAPLFHFRQILVHHLHCDGPLSHGRGHALNGRMAGVPRGKHPRNDALENKRIPFFFPAFGAVAVLGQKRTRQQIAALIHGEQATQPSRTRHGADKDKEGAGRL